MSVVAIGFVTTFCLVLASQVGECSQTLVMSWLEDGCNPCQEMANPRPESANQAYGHLTLEAEGRTKSHQSCVLLLVLESDNFLQSLEMPDRNRDSRLWTSHEFPDHFPEPTGSKDLRRDSFGESTPSKQHPLRRFLTVTKRKPRRREGGRRKRACYIAMFLWDVRTTRSSQSLGASVGDVEQNLRLAGEDFPLC